MESALITIPISEYQRLIEGISEISKLRAKIAELEARQDTDIERLALDIALDRQRLAKLEKIEPQPLQKDRGEILRALLAANGGKMLAKDARQKLRMDKGNFSRLLDTLKDHIDIKPLNSDKRKLLLIIKSRELVVHN
ncbi:MAG: hypothetical protein NTX42_01245 [Methanothrix sp.]|nr:hypothetical protein [Methanothrix sp.]